MTNKQIQFQVTSTAGSVPKTCWIADVLDSVGERIGRAPNRIDPLHRTHPCPLGKRPAIIAALYKLGKLGIPGRKAKGNQ
jgi:hypothetical protein